VIDEPGQEARTFVHEGDGGKINRLGLSVKPARSMKPIAPEKRVVNGKASPARPAPRPKASPIMLPRTKPHLIERPAQRLTSPTGIRIYDLREGHCRWPLGDDRPAKFFCSAPTVPSKAWCEHHYRMAYGHAPPPQTQAHEDSPEQILLHILRRRGRPRRVETAHAVP
jgi:hypothetical protein